VAFLEVEGVWSVGVIVVAVVAAVEEDDEEEEKEEEEENDENEEDEEDEVDVAVEVINVPGGHILSSRSFACARSGAFTKHRTASPSRCGEQCPCLTTRHKQSTRSVTS
jgi:hypothetical protein